MEGWPLNVPNINYSPKDVCDGKDSTVRRARKTARRSRFPRITVHNHSKTQLTRMNDCCALFIIGISLERVTFKKKNPSASRTTPSTRQTRLKGNPQECSDINVYVVWYIVISRVDIAFSDRLTAASLARVLGVFPVAFRNGSVLCIMSSSNNGHKVSYKRCQNVVIIIAVS